MSWLEDCAVEERGAGQGAGAWVTAAFVVANIPGVLLAGLLLNRGTPRWLVMATGAAAMGVTTLGILAAGAADGLRFGCVLAFSTLGGLIPGAIFSATPVHAK